MEEEKGIGYVRRVEKRGRQNRNEKGVLRKDNER